MSKIVKVIDSMMGTGKTSYAIQMMKEADMNQKFIFVTPFLNEVQRIKQEVTNKDFKEPNVTHGSGTKLESLKRLIANGEDIATTHSLFAMADEELIDLLRWENYTLIVDEVMDVISMLQGLRRDDIPVLLDSGLIKISEENQVIWQADPTLDTKYNIVRDYALAGNLYAVNNTAFVWNFPAKIFDLFERVYIMTYMFDGQLQRYYYDLHNVKYDYFSVVREGNRYQLQPKSEIIEDRSRLREFIHIYEGKLNEIGEIKNSLSKSWFENSHNCVKVKRLKDNLYNYFRNVQKANADRILWTTFKDHSNKVKGKGFSKVESENKVSGDVGLACFTSFNLRATNRYRHKEVLAFCLNRFMNPIEEHFFLQQNVKVDEDLLALSDLLQWIFRSAVRDGKPVHIYIPSRRMRDLLKKWLNNEL
ncbi:DEAD/DEAH box helicase family protein [Neobacillus drentensis]|uniref:DEAD/DEAH box helicase family protein n=1 Tax=Neobacillus drentensis TaxID=220684 RepID=UPI002FFE8D61